MRAGATPPPVPRKPRNWLPAIIIACAFTPLLILLIVFISYRVSNASAVRKLEARIKQKGEPLTLADLAVTYPPIPHEDNGAVLLVKLWKEEDPEFWTAFLEGVRPLPARSEPRWDDALPFLGAEARRISRTTELSPENLAAAEAFLDERRDYFEKLRQALRKPRFRFPIELTEGINTLIPHLGHVKSDAQAIQIEVLLATERKDVDEAIAGLEDIACTGNTVASEPLLISQLVRVACYNMALEAAERFLSRQDISEDQFERLNRILDQLAMPRALRLVLLSERVSFLDVMELNPEAVGDSLSAPNEDSVDAYKAPTTLPMRFLSFSGIKDADRRLMLETLESAVALAERDDAAALAEYEALFLDVALKARKKPPKIYCAMLLPVLEKAAIRFARLEARRRAALVALAVERFRLANGGSTLESLNELVPQFLPSVPTDPFDGERLRYKKLPTGFVVYSIGPDRTDDGGVEPLQRGRQKNFDVTFVVER